MTSWLATLTVLAKREQIDPMCPLSEEEEDNNHIFICTHRLALIVQLQLKLASHLLATHKCPKI